MIDEAATEVAVDEPPRKAVVDEASPNWRLYEVTSVEPEPCQTSVPRSTLPIVRGDRPSC